ncbi:hypothetical protein [Streptomyces sp. NPDC001985]|uniref:hypothetical protein n=1 Tax=Streptomyces sp. NPDC001985 TaxID=3154406 RepID=UPI00332048CF
MPLLPLHPDTAHLAARREQLLSGLTEPANGFLVAVYALTTSDRAPARTLERVTAYAVHRGWRVHAEVLWDGCGMTEPLGRAGWRRAEELVVGGFVQGVVTAGQSAVSTAAGEYEQVLDRLGSRRTFLAHVPLGWEPAGGSAPGIAARRADSS